LWKGTIPLEGRAVIPVKEEYYGITASKESEGHT
jgi:hypothetical protein